MLQLDISFRLYCVISTTIAACICGGCVTGLTYPLYNGKEDETKMFAWPSTVAGDVVITTIATSAIMWLISSRITMIDCKKEKPFHVVNKPTLDSLPASLHSLASRVQKPIFTGEGAAAAFCRLFHSAITGAIIGVVLTLLVGTIFVVVGYFATNDEWTMDTLLIYFGCLGGILGLILQPFIAVLAATEFDEEEASTDYEELPGTDEETT